MLHIFTLTWNKLSMLATLNASLRPALNGIDWKWHIKDNGSKDETIINISNWENVIPYAYPNNKQSFAEGMNYLFNQANPKDNDLILLLNNDLEFHDADSIHQMVSLLKDDVGVVGARLLYTGTNTLQHAGVVFHNYNQLPIHFKSSQESDAASKENRYFQAVTGAVLLTKAEYYRQIFKENKSGIHGMDETYQWMYEDIDLCLSINKLNKKIVYCGKTNISHRESASLKDNPMNKLFLNHNINRFRSKWHGKYECDYPKYIKDNTFGLIK